VPRALAVLGAFSNGSAHVTRAGSVLFTSTRDGLPQLYVGDVAHPADPPRRLPVPEQRVVGVTLTPDERAAVFASDVGADGNFHLFRIGLDGGGLVDLTPGEKMHRDPAVFARSTRGLFAYSAHAPSSERTRVFLQDLSGTPPREVYADERGGELADLSPDGKHALFVRLNADEDAVVFDIDTGSGKARRLFPPEGQTARASVVYAADARRVHVATETQGRPAELLTIDVATGKTLARYEESELPSATLAPLASPTGDRVAVVASAGNHSVIRLLDARTLKLQRTLATPLGAAFPTEFTRDGKRLALVESHPDEPADVYLADVATGAVTPLRRDARPGLPTAAPMKVSIEPLRSPDGLTIPVNLYLPGELQGKLPTLVMIHGGPTGSAFLRWNPATRFYSQLGYAIVEPNIRGSDGFGVAFASADNKEKRAFALADVELVNRWARAQPWCDGERLVIGGGSYGGYMTLLALGRQPDLWSAGLDVSGMSDLRSMERLEDQAIRVYDETEFGVLGKEDALLYDWSPLKYVDAIRAPVFVYQGVGDPITPQNEADQMVKALRSRGVPVEYMLVANEGHGLTRRDNNATYLARTARFLEEHASSRR
jgi:dipeptidyl aminopeptidase/acylaminoacyl peptidase